MDMERLRKIIAFNEQNRFEAASKARIFYYFIGLSVDREMLNTMQIARAMLDKKGYLMLELPLSDKEIGALCYRGEGLGYIVLNSSLPRVTMNFAVCHEMYHVFFQQSISRPKIEFAGEQRYGEASELFANLFAGMLLMPEGSFISMYHQFRKESNGREIDTIARLMSYFQAPYMAVLIRCLELGLIADGVSLETLLSVKDSEIKARFDELWLDDSILQPSGRDDFARMETRVRRTGETYVDNGYIKERTLQKVLANMRSLYEEVKEA